MRARALARAALTKRAVDAARYTGNGRAPCMLWDGKVPGFGLRVHPTGKRQLFVYYRNDQGRQREKTLGAVGCRSARHFGQETACAKRQFWISA